MAKGVTVKIHFTSSRLKKTFVTTMVVSGLHKDMVSIDTEISLRKPDGGIHKVNLSGDITKMEPGSIYCQLNEKGEDSLASLVDYNRLWKEYEENKQKKPKLEVIDGGKED